MVTDLITPRCPSAPQVTRLDEEAAVPADEPFTPRSPAARPPSVRVT